MSVPDRPTRSLSAPLSAAGRRVRLSGRTPQDLASQAIWWAYPAGRGSDTVRSLLLAWYGVTGPAPTTEALLAGTGRSRATIIRATRHLRDTLHTRIQPLTATQRDAITAPLRPGEDQRARGRIAALFDLPRPRPAPQPSLPSWGARGAGIGRVAVRCLAALGPLTFTQLAAAVHEYRHRRSEHAGDPVDDLLELFQRSRALHYDDTTDRWALNAPREPLGSDAELLTAIRRLGEVFSHVDYRQAVAAAGFSSGYRVPWVVHVDQGRGRYTTIDRLGDTLRHRQPSARARAKTRDELG